MHFFGVCYLLPIMKEFLTNAQDVAVVGALEVTDDVALVSVGVVVVYNMKQFWPFSWTNNRIWKELINLNQHWLSNEKEIIKNPV